MVTVEVEIKRSYDIDMLFSVMVRGSCVIVSRIVV
jgi:hypothetical protein